MVIAHETADFCPNADISFLEQPIFGIVDLFCGAGGTSTGFSKAKMKPSRVFGSFKEFEKIAKSAGFDDFTIKETYNKSIPVCKVIAAVNHDPGAIKSHWFNHKEVRHFEEDILTLDLTEFVKLVKEVRALYPRIKIILWASLECTNFSKAKGGLPRDADSRTLAWGLPRYIEAINPEYVQIENVVEFMSWGPLDAKGKPVSRKNGQDWLKWRQFICENYGYKEYWKELNSADFGAYTSRNRLFGCFAKYDLPIVWPSPTHAKKPSKGHLFGDLKPWKPVRDVLDLQDEGQSIFNRKKPLVDASLERIYSGLIKFVAGGKDEFLLKYNSVNKNTGVHIPPSIDSPCPVIPAQNRLGLVSVKRFSFIAKYYSGKPDGKVIGLDGPAGTIKTSDGQCLITASFLTSYYGNSKGSQSIDNPAGTISTKDRFGLLKVNWFDKQFSGVNNHQSLNQPAGSILSNDKHCLMTASPFIVSPSFRGNAHSLDNPAPTILASRKHHYIINPSYGGHSSSVINPCPVIIARQDKSPLYLLTAETGEFRVPIYEGDSEIMVKIKQFMCLYGISDIKMRMLKVLELLLIQGFSSDYKLFGNESDKKKFIGNSVVPILPESWSKALGKAILLRYLNFHWN
ncbi:DNA (cytosine-5)-methyltransferase 1 [Pseudarcicella hirudinis]|uniref:DNA (cytosine-5-)-methyltransferase n=1 Tax=Pseudarcicella hirudinis TaxID=1079859 RepID=A0A1I5RTZ6_9BACT|nr:DNA cytosine methyltransferase [Pseudarcicella hirudinis]SFP62039.1 DNA (cytosine-5)-methyltransferase 1 [Pseudarcicella hirudinis]